MIELPVQKRSARSTKPKRGFDHSTSSSAKRDRCTMTIAAAASNSIAKSRSDDGVERIRRDRVEAQLARDARAVDRKRGARERGRAERQSVHALAAVGEALGVAREHRLVGQEVMAERHRLRDLQVREAGHDRVGVLLGQVDERAAQRGRAAPAGRRSRRAATAARRWRSGRCASAPVCRRLPASPTSAVSRRSMLRWTSSWSSDHANVPSRDLRADRGHAALDVGQVLRGEDARRRRACARARASRRCRRPPDAGRTRPTRCSA